MYKATKRYLLDSEGKAVEAGPGIGGTLLVAEGGEMSEDDAIKYGLLASKQRPKNQVAPPPTKEEKKSSKVAPIIDNKVLTEKPWGGEKPAALPLGDKKK